NAVFVTLEEGKVRTGDVVGYDKCCKTTEFADTVIANLGRKSSKWKVRDYKPIKLPELPKAPDLVKAKSRRVVGVDVFVESPLGPEELGKNMEQLTSDSPVKLKMIANRGTKVYPAMGAITDCTDQYRGRFLLKDAAGELSDGQIMDILQKVATRHR